MADGIRAVLGSDFHQTLRDQRARDRSAQQVQAFILRVGTEHREDVITDEFFAQVFDVDVFRLDAQHFGFLACGLQFFALTKVSGEGDHFAAILGLQPFQDDRGIKATGIGQNNFLRCLLRCSIGRNHRFPFHERIARRLYVFKGKSKDHRACSARKRAAPSDRPW